MTEGPKIWSLACGYRQKGTYVETRCKAAMLSRSHAQGTETRAVTNTSSEVWLRLWTPGKGWTSCESMGFHNEYSEKSWVRIIYTKSFLLRMSFQQTWSLSLTLLLASLFAANFLLSSFIMQSLHLFLCVSNIFAFPLGSTYLWHKLFFVLSSAMLDDDISVWRLARLRTHTLDVLLN